MRQLLTSINNSFSVIGISETWLQDSTHHVNIYGYNFEHIYRTDKTGGGVGLYIIPTLQYKIRNDLCFGNSFTVESLFIEIFNPEGKNAIVGVMFRPPSQNLADFISKLNILMGKISRKNKSCYLMGDFNLNLLSQHCHQFTNEFLDMMYANTFFPLITLPTRITLHSANFIDNIFTNDFDHYAFSGLVLTDISDHLPVFTVSNEKMKIRDEVRFVQYNGVCPQKMTIQCGVLQGSILGPLLFLLCVNDICNFSNVFHMILFADDTDLFCSSQNWLDLINQVNFGLNKLFDWFSANKLSINFKKTKYMLFKRKQKRCNTDLKLLINNIEIGLAKEVSFLGVILDEHFTWKAYISYVARKVSKSIGVIRNQVFIFLNHH